MRKGNGIRDTRIGDFTENITFRGFPLALKWYNFTLVDFALISAMWKHWLRTLFVIPTAIPNNKDISTARIQMRTKIYRDNDT